MKQNWIRGTVSSIRPGGHRAVFAGAASRRLIGDTGLSLPERTGPPRFEDFWEGGGVMPMKVRRAIEVEPRFTGIEVVLGLTESRDGRAIPDISMLARAGTRLVALLAIDANSSDAHLIATRLADTAQRSQRFCASAAILVLHSTEQSALGDLVDSANLSKPNIKQGAFDHYVAMAAARGIPSAKRNVLYLVDGASKAPVYTVWIEGV
jgi:hypothetical protein